MYSILCMHELHFFNNVIDPDIVIDPFATLWSHDLITLIAYFSEWCQVISLEIQ